MMAVNLQICIHATGHIKLFSFVIGCFHISVLPLVLIIYKMGAPVNWGFGVSVMITLFVLLFDIILVKKKVPDFSFYGYKKNVVFPIVSTLVLSVITPPAGSKVGVATLLLLISSRTTVMPVIWAL